MLNVGEGIDVFDESLWVNWSEVKEVGGIDNANEARVEVASGSCWIGWQMGCKGQVLT